MPVRVRTSSQGEYFTWEKVLIEFTDGSRQEVTKGSLEFRAYGIEIRPGIGEEHVPYSSIKKVTMEPPAKKS